MPANVLKKTPSQTFSSEYTYLNIFAHCFISIETFFLNRSDFRTDQYLLNGQSHFDSKKLLNKGKANKKTCAKCENLTSEVMWHKNCWRELSDLKYLPCGFNEYGNDANGDNSNSNHNDNNKNDNNNGYNDNKHNNINNDIDIFVIVFCNSLVSHSA